MPVSPDSWPDLAGRLKRGPDGLTHILAVRVYFEDTDFSGLVYHGSYVRWFERGRSDFLRLLGNDHDALLKGGGREPAAFVVRRLTIDYLKPARIDEVLEVRTRVIEARGASLRLGQVIARESQTICEAEVLAVLLGTSGKLQRLDRGLLDKLETLEP